MRPTRATQSLRPAAFLLVALAASAYTPPPLFRGDINIQPAKVCRNCHLDITSQWEASPHSKAHRYSNALYGRMYFNSLKRTRGETFRACGPCHETTPFLTNDFEFIREISLEGVACAFCHGMHEASRQGIPPALIDLNAYYGTIRVPAVTPNHRSAYSGFLAKSEFCGACHQYANQHGVPISTTLDEWKRSKFAKQGVTCQSCHMPGGPGRNAIDGPSRARVADHSFADAEGNKALQGAATLALRLGRRTADTLRVFATAANVGAGHALPTGNDQHMLLIRVRALTEAGQIVWENDPFQEWTVSVFTVLLADEFGVWPAETWTARKVVADRRIPAGGSAQVRYDIPLQNAEGPLRVEAQLLFRRARPQTIAAYGLSEEAYGVERTLATATLRVP